VWVYVRGTLSQIKVFVVNVPYGRLQDEGVYEETILIGCNV
jgi:hypothetical protein